MELSCEMCRDLMPLVMDGVACEESREAVERHLESCEECKLLYEEGVPTCDGERALSKTVKRVQTLSAVAVGAVVLLGICLCEMVMQGSSLVFLLVVLVIRSLLRVVFSREKGKILKKTAALVSALALTAGILWAGNEVFGNPVTKTLAEHHIQGYLAGAYGDTDYYIEDVSYAMSSTTYEAEVRSLSEPEFVFYIVYRDGKLIYDTYEEVISGLFD